MLNTVAVSAESTGGEQNAATVELGDLFIKTAEISLEPGTYDFICSVPGHADGEMKGVITVANGGGTEGASADHREMDHSVHATMSPQEMLDADAARTALFPAETKGTGGKLLEPTIEPTAPRCSN